MKLDPDVGILGRRASLMLGVALYLALYNWLYITWLAPTFGYAGMTYREPQAGMLVFAWVLAFMPSLWMPMDLDRVSQVPYWLIYLMVYIPSMFGPMYMALQSDQENAVLMVCFLAGFVIISLTYFFPPVKLRLHLISRRVFWKLLALVTAVLDLWVIVVFHSHMHLVGFYDVYTLRSAADEVAKGTSVGYATMLLSSVINPLYMSLGVVWRRKPLVLLGALNQLLLYSTGGNKAVILSPILIVGFYLVIGRTGRRFGLRLVGALLAVLVVLCIISSIKDVNPILGFALSLLFMRTFAIGGFNTGAFADFFHSHSLTHLSSVHGIDFFIHYPYASQLGVVVGYSEMGNPDLDMNAHFWASDGIAAFGPLGIVYISILCALVFWVLDSAATRHQVLFAALTVAFVTFNLTNVSLFTTLVSGGLGLLIVVLISMPSVDKSLPYQTTPCSVESAP